MLYAYPVRDALQLYSHHAAEFAEAALNPFSDLPVFAKFRVCAKILAGVTLNRGKPTFGITQTEVDGRIASIHEQKIWEKPFGNLLHFKYDAPTTRPKMLLVAPMSGHYATLLRGTVEGLLPHFDVCITDWNNARDVPLSAGKFGFADFTDYCSYAIESFQPDVVMAVCQPGPAVAAALAMRAEDGFENPRVAIFAGSPFDTRISPTAVTELAKQQPLEWFKQNLIEEVPCYYSGAGREVYPGGTQLGSFMAMNAETHLKKFGIYADNILKHNTKDIIAHDKFYNEYFSVMDLPAEFYLQTVDIVFQRYLVPERKLEHRGRHVDFGALTETAVLAIEGLKDDITGLGQVKAAHDLLNRLPDFMKAYHPEKVGHYGLFSGSAFRNRIVPLIVSFVDQHLRPNNVMVIKPRGAEAVPL